MFVIFERKIEIKALCVNYVYIEIPLQIFLKWGDIKNEELD